MTYQVTDIIDVTVPLQTVTFVYGQPVSFLSENDLFNALTSLQAEINSLTEQNAALGSTVIAARIAKLETAKKDLLAVLDKSAETVGTVGTAVTAAPAAE